MVCCGGNMRQHKPEIAQTIRDAFVLTVLYTLSLIYTILMGSDEFRIGKIPFFWESLKHHYATPELPNCCVLQFCTGGIFKYNYRTLKHVLLYFVMLKIKYSKSNHFPDYYCHGKNFHKQVCLNCKKINVGYNNKILVQTIK